MNNLQFSLLRHTLPLRIFLRVADGGLVKRQKPRFAVGTEVEGTSAEGKNIRGRITATLSNMVFVDNSGSQYRCHVNDLRAIVPEKEE